MWKFFTLPWYSYLRKTLAIIFIILGIAALVTPFTPGSWLIPIGIVMIIGKEKAFILSKRLLGERWHKKLRIEAFFHRIIKK